ncbi:SLC13 family permease [Devosia sp. J2-20]|jgi:di/tricarboxylate transporter|uniref:SLC13 family permease n=1 Tax=Devosia litorisediminis TaxID=2829817 RepID=A0A942I512_9HYPH|nr:MULTISPECIES: SLC13 family permease [Devosia]MBS3848151.1 SLC13 family permease [Devosia litorisediminis]MCZ4345335.1 SLC13 family permease [Devosia neptuniae]WDQ98748.1 SLC13 family permease [Devosia sp. J2-20]|tara:strand:+ start:6998 stop:8767 length:1770 start_codon:yes stop_codon:yes gene_type:complete
MTLQQSLAFLLIGAMMVAFIWGRWRYDVVAVAALLASLAIGVVSPAEAFSGFSDDIVIIVGSALIVSAAVSRSGIMEVAVRRFAPNISGPRAQLILLVTVVAVLSAFVKNIGALAIMMPIAFQMARRSGVSPSLFLMPMAFASLLGGLMTQIGTSPNIIVSRVRMELTGEAFSMFDYTPVGLALTVVGVIFLALFYKLLPVRQRETQGLDSAVEIKNYTTEARVTEDSSAIGRTIGDIQALADGRGMVTRIVGAGGRPRTPLPDAKLRAGDILLIAGEPEALDKMVNQSGLVFSERRGAATKDAADFGVIEAVIGESSGLIGATAQELTLFDRTGLNLLAVSRREERFTERLGQIRFQNGDVILIQGHIKRLPELLREWDCLPLVERGLRLGSIRNGLVPLVILAIAMGASALGLVPVAPAFFAAAVAMVLSRAIPLRDVYNQLDAPILIMLACLIPVADSLRTTGGTEIIAGWLSLTASTLPGWGALALIMVAAMAVTPFLNNAATVLVMAPIAATFATELGYQPEAFLLAVAIGAGCDFLTPIGHQCNTLVMGPGGYKFGDYWRLGAPLSLIVVLVAVPMLMLVWPF